MRRNARTGDRSAQSWPAGTACRCGTPTRQRECRGRRPRRAWSSESWSRPSEGVRQPSAEQMRVELENAGVAGERVDEAAPVALLDVLITDVSVQLGRQVDPRADRELVTRALGEQRRHELRRRRARVKQVAAA